MERLNQLDAPPSADRPLSPMPIPLPAIIEADPSFPMPAPSAVDVAAAAAIARAAAAAGTVTDPDAPTEAVSTSPAATTVSAPAATEPTVAVVAPLLFVPDAVPDFVPDRTATVPVLAPAPTEAMPSAVIGDDIDGSFGLVLPQRPLQRPIAFRRGKPRVRRVTRVVRHVDPWSVFKVALVFNTILFVVCLTSGVLLWNVANATGTVDNVEKFFEQFGWSSFDFNGGALYHNAWIAGLFGALFLTGMAVFLATVFNLITDLVGGIRVSVLEEEVMARSVTYPGARSLTRFFDRGGDDAQVASNAEGDQPG
ncbi:MAG: hypothetical protein JWN99_2576 [Ilumatobacteraceae bacterium]|nr:hypothetical protein [Ilumatobacteraceae bacterium]